MQFLGDSECTMDLIRTDAVLAVDNEPCSGEPILKRDRRILEDSSRLQRELCMVMLSVALPHALLRDVKNLVRSTPGTLHRAIGPAQFNHELAAMLEVSEPEDRVSECVGAFHTSSILDFR